tara:strand:- start:3214 stop:4278 length:1065 start_codon:yes stop_codon:yes gene_type:complete
MTSNQDIFLNKSKVCCISDIHVGVHQNSTQWHNIILKWAKWLRSELESKDISDIIISGDFFHYRDEIAVNTIHFVTSILEEWRQFNIIILVGNHDAWYKDRSDVNSLSILSGWSNIKVISDPTTATLFGKSVTFCPWGTKVKDIPGSDVVFGHFEITTFKQNTFKICSEGIRSKDLLSKSGLIISGHFHLREERKYDDGTILYLGSPFEMTFGDADSTKGYYILDLDTLKYDFTENTLSPKHKKIHLSELVKVGSINAKVKKWFKNNFVKLVVDKNVAPDDMDVILRKLSSLNAKAVNVDYSQSFNQYNLDEDSRHDFAGIEVKSAIEEFINLLEIDNKKEIIDYTLDVYDRCT